MSRYFYRLLVFSLALCAAPVILTGIISYFIASKDIEEKVAEGNTQILQQSQMRMEQALKNVEIGAVQYINSSPVSDYMYTNLTNDQFQTISSLSKGLYNLHSIAGVEDTHLINLEHHWMISNLGFTSSAEFSDDRLLSEYARSLRNMYWLASAPMEDRMGENDSHPDHEKVRLVVKLPMISPDTVPKALLIIDLSHSTLTEYLSQNTQLGSMYVLNQEKEPFLTNSASKPIPSPILHKLAGLANGSGSFEEGDTAVNYMVSSHNGWSYMSLVSIDEITRESKKIALISLNACMLIFLAIGAAAFYGTRRMYRPIHRLSTILEQIGGDSGAAKKRDEFAFIEDRFHSLFSTRKELQQQLHVQRGQVKEFFLLKLFMGQVTESEFSYKNETYGFAERGMAMGVLALQIDSLEHTRYMERDKELLLFAINNVVGELLPGDQVLGTLLLDQSQVTLLVGDSDDPNEWKADFNRTAETIKHKVQELFRLNVSIGISRPFHRYTNAADAYTEALEALKRRISLGNELILSYEDIEASSSNQTLKTASLNQLEDNLINALKTGDSATTYEHYNQYVSHILEKSVPFNDYQILMVQLITRIYRVVQEQGGSLDGLVGAKSVMNRFMKLGTVEEISAWFKTVLIPPTLAFLKGRIDSQYINIAQQLVEIIHTRYDQDITLESCAQQFNYHPIYVSRVFKKEMGVTFIDYLTSYRMSMAKIWLKDSNMKITEIAERLNYTNSTGFIRTFRKATGMTPGQYRDAHSNPTG